MTSDPSPPAPAGQALLSTKTALALIAALIATLLPPLLTSFGIPTDQQPAVLQAIQQIGGPILIVLGIFFRASATKKVTHIIPKIGSGPGPAALASIIALCLIAPGLSGCETHPLTPPDLAVPVAQGDAAVDLAFNVAAKAYLDQAPQLSAAAKARVKDLLLNKAYPLVQAIDAATILGNETSMPAQIADAMALIGQAKAALGVQ